MAVQRGAWIAIYCPSKRAFLLGKRSKLVNNPFVWNFFGGAIDAGESPKKAAIRELREETGIKAGKSDLVPLDHIELRGLGHTGDERDLYYYLVLLDQPIKPKLNEENSEYRWFDQNNLPLSLNRATSEAIRRGYIEKAIAYAAKHKSKTLLV
jgi:8-oxo-dGTP pyrophosphatase MutT (NUDIX family)